MAVNRIDLFPRQTENTNEIRQTEAQRQNARETFGALNKNLKSAPDKQNDQKPTRDLWSGDASRQQTFEELKTLVRAVQTGETDPFKLTDLIFYARHPEMIGKSLANEPDLLDEWNSISALLVHPTLNEVGNILGVNLEGGEIKGRQAIETAFEGAANSKVKHLPISGVSNNLYDEVIARSVEWCPGLSPHVLKSLLAQESNFRPTVINSYGYAGIAQFGRTAAREVGLNVGIAGSASDERLNPDKAIPASARLLNIKAKRLGEIAFSKYGQPSGRGILEICSRRLQRRRRHGRFSDGQRASRRRCESAGERFGRCGCRAVCPKLRFKLGKSKSRRHVFPARTGGGAIFSDDCRAEICRNRQLSDADCRAGERLSKNQRKKRARNEISLRARFFL